LQRYGVRPIEALITVLVGVIAASYIIETFLVKPDWGQIAYHSVVPWLGKGSVLISVGIVGATVMPHVVYLHSALTQDRIVPRSEAEAKRIFHFTIPDIVIAMGLAGVINMAMLYMAASTFFKHNMTNVADIPCRLSHPDTTVGSRRGGRLRRLSSGVRHLLVHRGDNGRSGHHAGVCRLHHPDLGPAHGNHAACRHHRRDRRRSHAIAHHQSGHPEHGAATPRHRAHLLHAPASISWAPW